MKQLHTNTITRNVINYVYKIQFDPLFTRKCIIKITCDKIIIRDPDRTPAKSGPPRIIPTNGHNNIHTARNNICQ
jgi:hypothetical protein